MVEDYDIDLSALLLPTKKKRNTLTPPRPLNQFMLFRRSIQQSLRDKYPNILNTEISRIAGHLFKHLSPEKKRAYAEYAQAEADAHRRKYPNYKYKPRPKPSQKEPTESCSAQVETVLEKAPPCTTQAILSETNLPQLEAPCFPNISYQSQFSPTHLWDSSLLMNLSLSGCQWNNPLANFSPSLLNFNDIPVDWALPEFSLFEQDFNF
ncbi:Transcription factor SOX-17 [Entomophthora muscae]|uniref:Transcription factor SOX-17 n=1 Tax=Entomophthora muscae TaxID=34485 RepID=A0ACC2UIV2_9FUNG|nr:Transcription factor SOX-17 [Entomophthora muscae]